jgi:hypothetical protein
MHDGGHVGATLARRLGDAAEVARALACASDAL